MSVEVSGISVSLGEREVLDDINLTFEAGTLTAIVGPNGAGKSTLLRTVAGDISPDAGTISFDGSRLDDHPPRSRARIRSFLPQDHASAMDFPVRDVVAFGRYSSDDPDGDAIVEAMRRVEVSHLADRRFCDLSGGEQRRVSIARVLAQGADVVLMDEPTDRLDLGHADMMMGTAADEARVGRTVIASSHDLNVAARYASTIVLLAEGSVRAVGGPAHVLTSTLLTEVYQAPVQVLLHPDLNVPVVYL